MARANYNTPIDENAILAAVALLRTGLDACDSERSAHQVADTTRQSCLTLLAEEMKLLKAAQSEIAKRSNTP